MDLGFHNKGKSLILLFWFRLGLLIIAACYFGEIFFFRRVTGQYWKFSTISEFSANNTYFECVILICLCAGFAFAIVFQSLTFGFEKYDQRAEIPGCCAFCPKRCCSNCSNCTWVVVEKCRWVLVFFVCLGLFGLAMFGAVKETQITHFHPSANFTEFFDFGQNRTGSIIPDNMTIPILYTYQDTTFVWIHLVFALTAFRCLITHHIYKLAILKRLLDRKPSWEELSVEQNGTYTVEQAKYRFYNAALIGSFTTMGVFVALEIMVAGSFFGMQIYRGAWEHIDPRYKVVFYSRNYDFLNPIYSRFVGDLNMARILIPSIWFLPLLHLPFHYLVGGKYQSQYQTSRGRQISDNQ
jgi:hypothetical protein